MLNYRGRQSGVCLHDRSQRRVYRTYMCGLCHALGDQYGSACRLFTSHELTLLNLITSALTQVQSPLSQRNCPLNPFLAVNVNQDEASRYSAAVAIELAKAKFSDDIYDSRGMNMLAGLAYRLVLSPHHLALQVLSRLGFDYSCFLELDQAQKDAELDHNSDASFPSAQLSGKLFSMCANLAGTPEHSTNLSTLGKYYGEFVYLNDAFQDFPIDFSNGNYNPLQRYARSVKDGVLLTRQGMEWLITRLKMILENIRITLPKIYFVRHTELIEQLLLQLVTLPINILERYVRSGEGIRYSLWGKYDPLRASLFMLPEAFAFDSPYSPNSFSSERPDSWESEWLKSINDSGDPIESNCGSLENCTKGMPDLHDVDWQRTCCCGIKLCRNPESVDQSDETPPSDKIKDRPFCDSSTPWLCDPCFLPRDCHWPNMDCQHIRCESIDCSHLNCTHLDCSFIDCSHLDCGSMDCGNVDCGGADCNC